MTGTATSGDESGRLDRSLLEDIQRRVTGLENQMAVLCRMSLLAAGKLGADLASVSGTGSDVRQWAVTVLLDESHHLPRPLAEELRRYRCLPDDRPAGLSRQRDACYVLLDSEIPGALETEVRAHARRLDRTINPRAETDP